MFFTLQTFALEPYYDFKTVPSDKKNKLKSFQKTPYRNF